MLNFNKTSKWLKGNQSIIFNRLFSLELLEVQGLTYKEESILVEINKPYNVP